jgi:hypothetical protein
MQIQSGSFSDTAATRQRTEGAGVAGQGVAVQQALEDAVAADVAAESVLPSGAEEVGAVKRQSETAGVIDIKAHSAAMEATKVAFEARIAALEANLSLESAQFSLGAVDQRNSMRERVSYLEQVEPVPATELSSQEADTVRKLLEADGRGVSFGEDGTFMALLDDKMYTFSRDGKATVHENGVPTSEDERQSWLADSRKILATLEQATRGLSRSELQKNLDAASSASEEAQARADRLSATAEEARGRVHVDVTV